LTVSYGLLENVRLLYRPLKENLAKIIWNIKFFLVDAATLLLQANSVGQQPLLIARAKMAG
jgi:hypothetical protein